MSRFRINLYYLIIFHGNKKKVSNCPNCPGAHTRRRVKINGQFMFRLDFALHIIYYK
jgi:hypothetical protein